MTVDSDQSTITGASLSTTLRVVPLSLRERSGD